MSYMSDLAIQRANEARMPVCDVCDRPDALCGADAAPAWARHAPCDRCRGHEDGDCEACAEWRDEKGGAR